MTKISYQDKIKNKSLHSFSNSAKTEMQKVKQMASIKEVANEYVAPETYNVADLKKVSVELDVKTKNANVGTPDEFSYNYIEVEGKEYRVPNIVLKQLKAILVENADVKFFKVLKDGEGLKTTYLVMAV